jgi:hypothetical protein
MDITGITVGSAFEHEGEQVVVLRNGITTALVFDGVVYVFKPSSSSYGLCTPDGRRHQFVCQDGCCDAGLQQDVAEVVEAASIVGATKVVLRTGQRQFYRPTIAGLPVEDVSGHIGEIAKGLSIDRRR